MKNVKSQFRINCVQKATNRLDLCGESIPYCSAFIIRSELSGCTSLVYPVQHLTWATVFKETGWLFDGDKSVLFTNTRNAGFVRSNFDPSYDGNMSFDQW
jgi:hypothetical protein